MKGEGGGGGGGVPEFVLFISCLDPWFATFPLSYAQEPSRRMRGKRRWAQMVLSRKLDASMFEVQPFSVGDSPGLE